MVPVDVKRTTSFHCNFGCILYRFGDTVTYLRNIKHLSRDPERATCTLVLGTINLNTNFTVPMTSPVSEI